MIGRVLSLASLLGLVVGSAVVAQPVVAQEFDELYEMWPEQLKINGRVIVDNGMQDFGPVRPLLERVTAGKQVVCFSGAAAGDQPMLIGEVQAVAGDDGNVVVVNFRKLPVQLLQAALSTADVVVAQSVEDHREELLKLKPAFASFIRQGRTLIVDRSLADMLGEACVSPAAGGDAGGVAAGLDLLPNCLLVCGTSKIGTSVDELADVTVARPRTVGIGLEHDSMLVLSGRKMVCYGAGKAIFCLPATDQLPRRVESIAARESPRQPPWETLIDLTEWRRDAIDRTVDRFPPAEPPRPHVEQGTLLIVGGGAMPPGLMDRFIELAGGIEQAKLVYVPCSEQDDVGETPRTVRDWQKRGVKHATFIHTKDRRRANSDEAFLEPLQDATGIWYGGGRQWNFSDSYYGTKAHKLMKEVLRRGGVIGGSSAGASIQARYLARATPIGNTRIMAPGYERGGLGFIGGVAIDQHFSQRRRQQDMTALMKVHPQLLGIGLDETTAIEVRGSVAKVIGRGRTFFYNRREPAVDGEPDYIALPTGSIYDLAQRKVLVDTTEAPKQTTEPKPADDQNSR
jgi:cyanophycinase